MRPLEEPVVAGLFEPIGAGTLGLADAAWEVVGAVDPVEHDGAVAHRRTDQLVALFGQQRQHPGEAITVDEAHLVPP